jgi:hypothetical protein
LARVLTTIAESVCGVPELPRRALRPRDPALHWNTSRIAPICSAYASASWRSSASAISRLSTATCSLVLRHGVALLGEECWLSALRDQIFSPTDEGVQEPLGFRFILMITEACQRASTTKTSRTPTSANINAAPPTPRIVAVG